MSTTTWDIAKRGDLAVWFTGGAAVGVEVGDRVSDTEVVVGCGDVTAVVRTTWGADAREGTAAHVAREWLRPSAFALVGRRFGSAAEARAAFAEHLTDLGRAEVNRRTRRAGVTP
jgi:hypothetical protein